MAFEIIDCNTIFGPWPMVRADMSAERLLKALETHSVSRAMTASTVGVLHNHNDGNAETTRMSTNQAKLIPVATIDPRGYFGTPGLVARLVEQGFKMVRFFPRNQSWQLDHSSFQDVLDEIEKVNLPVMVQGGETGYPTALMRNFGGRKNVYILEGVSYENMAEAVSVMRKHDNILAETHELRVPGSVRFLVDQIGVERVVFGSGYLISSLAAALGYITEAELSDDQKSKVLSGNIKRVLGV